MSAGTYFRRVVLHSIKGRAWLSMCTYVYTLSFSKAWLKGWQWTLATALLVAPSDAMTTAATSETYDAFMVRVHVSSWRLCCQAVLKEAVVEYWPDELEFGWHVFSNPAVGHTDAAWVAISCADALILELHQEWKSLVCWRKIEQV